MLSRWSARNLAAVFGSNLRSASSISTPLRLLIAHSPKTFTIDEFSTSTISLKKKEVDLYSEDVGFLQRTYRNIFQGGSSVPKYELLRSGYDLLYVCSAKVDVVNFFKAFELPDTYFSWFLITELHVWMLLVRLNVGKTKEGRILRNSVIEAFWEDMDQRAKLVAHLTTSDRGNQIWDLAEEFQTALLLYDVGIVGTDKDLANAIWKRVYDGQDNVNPENLDKMVKYVRKTLVMLDDHSLNDFYYHNRKPVLKWHDILAVVKE